MLKQYNEMDNTEIRKIIYESCPKKCVNCTHCGRSGGGFFAECLCFGFQINDEYEHSCDEFACKASVLKECSHYLIEK